MSLNKLHTFVSQQRKMSSADETNILSDVKIVQCTNARTLFAGSFFAIYSFSFCLFCHCEQCDKRDKEPHRHGSD